MSKALPVKNLLLNYSWVKRKIQTGVIGKIVVIKILHRICGVHLSPDQKEIYGIKEVHNVLLLKILILILLLR